MVWSASVQRRVACRRYADGSSMRPMRVLTTVAAIVCAVLAVAALVGLCIALATGSATPVSGLILAIAMFGALTWLNVYLARRAKQNPPASR